MGDDVYYGTDPSATCPPSQAQTDAGLVDCSVAAVMANQVNNTYIAATLDISYANDPTPDPATATLNTTSGLTPGQSVTITGGQNWWGSGSDGAPAYVPSIATGTATVVPAPTVWIGPSRATTGPDPAVEATSNITITPATYNCGSSGGASTTSPGPVANCTLAQGSISGSFTVPSGLNCTTCNVYIDEPNLSLTQSTYGADGGTGSYNAGLSYDVVNAVESTPIPVCAPTCGSPTTPTVTGVSPSSGSTAGGTTVTITGTNLTGATAVSIAGTAPTSFTVNSPTQITAVTAASGAGEGDVTVTTAGGTSPANQPADDYTYVTTPTVTGVSPSSGSTAGGTTVTITGTNLTGATAVSIAGTAPTSFTVNSPTQITAVTAASGAGEGDVTVTTAGGTSPANPPADDYTYVATPTVTGVSPSSGSTAGGTTVTITGTNLTGATAVSIAGTAPTSFTVNSPTQITAVTAASGAGEGDVTVTTAGGTSPANPPADDYTYVTPPTVTGVSPNNGPTAGTNTVTVAGSGFVSGSTTVDFGSNAGTSVDVTSSSSLSVVVPAGSGTVPVTVITTGGGASTPLADAYTYVTTPTVTGVSPSSGSTAGGTTVTITGTNLTGATAVSIAGTAPTSFTVNSPTQITAVTAASGAGEGDVTVTTAGGTSPANPPADDYTYVTPPTVTGVSPNNGPTAGTNTVTVAGSGFVSGSTTVDFGSNAGTSVDVTSSSSLSVVVPAGSGTVPVTVITTGGGASTPLADAYTYVTTPTVTGVSPSSGSTAGGTTVTITGTNLTGATAVSIAGTAPTSFTVNSPTQITAVTAASGAGEGDVTVTTAGGTSPANPPADDYTYVTPGVSSLNLVKSTTAVGYGAAGTTIAYTYVITNTGSTTLTGVSVTDNKNTVSCPSATLASGANETCTGTYTVTASDDTAGSVTNTAVASATGPVAVSSSSSTVTVDACTAPVITSPNSVTAVTGSDLTFPISTCSVSLPKLSAKGLPKGLVLTDNKDGTGVISGTPSSSDSGTYAAQITAAVKGQTSAIQTLVVTVDNSPVFKSKDAATITAGNGPITEIPVTTEYGYPTPSITTTSDLPSGVSLIENGNGTADFTGTPSSTSGGVYVITIVAATGVTQPTSQTFTLTVDQAPTLGAPSSVTADSSVAVSPVTVDYAGYLAPKLKATDLPRGLALVNNDNGTATISGTPDYKDAGVYSTVITAKNKTGSVSITIVFTVDSIPTFSSRDAATITAGVGPITPFEVVTKYGYPTPSITTTSDLPSGVSLIDNGNGTADFTGSPSATSAGVYAITIIAATGITAPAIQKLHPHGKAASRMTVGRVRRLLPLLTPGPGGSYLSVKGGRGWFSFGDPGSGTESICGQRRPAFLALRSGDQAFRQDSNQRVAEATFGDVDCTPTSEK